MAKKTANPNILKIKLSLTVNALVLVVMFLAMGFFTFAWFINNVTPGVADPGIKSSTPYITEASLTGYAVKVLSNNTGNVTTGERAWGYELAISETTNALVPITVMPPYDPEKIEYNEYEPVILIEIRFLLATPGTYRIETSTNETDFSIDNSEIFLSNCVQFYPVDSYNDTDHTAATSLTLGTSFVTLPTTAGDDPQKASNLVLATLTYDQDDIGWNVVRFAIHYDESLINYIYNSSPESPENPIPPENAAGFTTYYPDLIFTILQQT